MLPYFKSAAHGSVHLICTLALLMGGIVWAASARADEAGRVVFVTGQAHGGGHALVLGDAVQEGDELDTGADGYIYMRTIDNGLLILRPESRARIVAYHVDKDVPENTRVKMELLSGVARSVSGQAVKKARQNFRFNTPVAAIGVRGTDFTVYTNAETSRVTVLSGAIIVSGFGGACLPGGSGPCEHSASRELSAKQVGQMLQIQRGQAQPTMLNNGNLAPDAITPPRPDEPSAKSTGVSPVPSATDVVNLDAEKTELLLHSSLVKTTASVPPVNVTTPVDPPAVVPPSLPVQPASEVVWGRWTAVLKEGVSIDTVALSKQGALPIAQNGYFAIYRTPGTIAPLPQQGTVGFALQQSEALIYDQSSFVISPASLQNGKMNIDFGKSTFNTSFDLVNINNTERFNLQSQGVIGRDGQMTGDSQFSHPTNMTVNGVVNNNSGGPTANYIFSSRLDNNRVASGITYWGASK
jgi:hypothetical protein